MSLKYEPSSKRRWSVYTPPAGARKHKLWENDPTPRAESDLPKEDRAIPLPRATARADGPSSGSDGAPPPPPRVRAA